MSGLIKAVAAIVLVAGIMMFLASRVSEQKMTRHEKPVSLDALNK
jgi:preprotein translocase subunit YajC